MIEGYIELLGLFPYFHDFKLEKIETSENSITLVVSTTHEIMKMNEETPSLKLESETHKKVTSIYIHQQILIKKGEDF